MADARNYLSLGRKAGRLETGEENCSILLRSGKAKLLVLASDASDNARRRAEGFLYGKKTPGVTVPYTKSELSAATGKNGCSMLAFTDLGPALSFIRPLESEMPGTYTGVLEQLEQKKQRIARRAAAAENTVQTKKTGKRRTSE